MKYPKQCWKCSDGSIFTAEVEAIEHEEEIFRNRQTTFPVEDKSKYLKEPWHSTEKELPQHSGSRCICYIPESPYNCEVEMIFNKSRPDSGYKDSFKECCAGNRIWDYDHIKYWRYYVS